MKCLACCGALSYCLLSMTLLAPAGDAVDDWSLWGALEHGVEAVFETVDEGGTVAAETVAAETGGEFTWCARAGCSSVIPWRVDDTELDTTDEQPASAACPLCDRLRNTTFEK